MNTKEVPVTETGTKIAWVLLAAMLIYEVLK